MRGIWKSLRLITTQPMIDQHPKHEDFITKIKQLERNQAVMGQVRMWAYYLTPQLNLKPEYPYLSFGHLVSFDASHGLNDEEWLSREEDKRTVEQPTEDTPLFEEYESRNSH